MLIDSFSYTLIVSTEILQENAAFQVSEVFKILVLHGALCSTLNHLLKFVASNAS